MAEYTVGAFGGIFFKVGDVRESSQPSTLKSNIGKTFVEAAIPLRNTTDIILQVNGVITGLSQTSGQTLATAIENDRASFTALEDGFKHVYSDGRHSGNFAMVSNSLQWDDSAERSPNESHKFTVTFVEWK